jgi:predicted esterase
VGGGDRVLFGGTPVEVKTILLFEETLEAYMIEITPKVVDSAFIYFHTGGSCGDEIAPFLAELQTGLPHTYIWAGDGNIDATGGPFMGAAVTYGVSSERYWFVFPMHGDGPEDFAGAVEPMGAVLVSCGGYINAFVDQVMRRFQIPASRLVLCGHQHGACVALAAAMMRRWDPFALTVLFDPWPLEAYYLQHERELPATKVVCVDNLWVRQREKQRGAATGLYRVFRQYGLQAEGVTLPQGQDQPDAYMFREAVHQIKAVFE